MDRLVEALIEEETLQRIVMHWQGSTQRRIALAGSAAAKA